MTDVGSAATAFRQAIIECPDTGLISLRDFPNGSCGDASPLLGQFLQEQGHGEWIYVSGCREGDFHSHAWLERDGWLLDITADQFPDVDEPVLLTQDRTWHSQFLHRPMKRLPARIDVWDEYTTQNLTEAYVKIMAVYERR
ncbi:hypothetical protein [Streptomyces sp. MBT33]|uniref:hypothetical protein n=1 Tax=Streptomyces sp. MBT33 TaxID=1488363 RepID=UPI00190A5B0C|nr:hypothetical protein [Streptomyces sp. MBT33]MBK3640474.1 hypothetical protein [Streptomyces sp. MBT33]